MTAKEARETQEKVNRKETGKRIDEAYRAINTQIHSGSTDLEVTIYISKGDTLTVKKELEKAGFTVYRSVEGDVIKLRICW